MARVESMNLLMAKSGLDDVVQVYLKNPKFIYPMMAKKLSTEQAFYRILQEADFSTAPAVAAATAIPIEEFETPYTKDYYPVKRALIAANSRESIQSDLYGIVNKCGKKLLLSVMKSMEVEAASFVNLATDTATLSKGPDGLALASAVHPIIGGTATNIAPVNPILTQSSLETMRQMFMAQLSHKGDPMMFDGPFDLFVPPALMSVAERVVGAQGFVGLNVNGFAAGNDPNVMGDSRVRIIVNPWFTSTTAYALRVRNDDEHGLRFISRSAPITRVWEDNNTDTVKTSVTAMFCRAIEDWRGFIFSDGTGV